MPATALFRASLRCITTPAQRVPACYVCTDLCRKVCGAVQEVACCCFVAVKMAAPGEREVSVVALDGARKAVELMNVHGMAGHCAAEQ